MKKKNYIRTPLYLALLIVSSSIHAFQSNGTNSIICDSDDCLQKAMDNAKPGDEIILKKGIYVGGKESPAKNYSAFSSDRDGEKGNPIILRGFSADEKPIITANRSGYSWYGLNMSGDYWIIKDIIVQKVLKGIVLDDASNCQLINVEVSDIGQEAIHLRKGSSNNLIKNCLVTNTGMRSEKDKGFGEGVYIGSDRGAHNRFDPNCNNNIVENCVFGPNISAEAFDIKEGTERTIIRNNTFYAEGITGVNYSDTFIDLKGLYGYVYGNTFNVDKGAENLNAIIDISNRTFGGYSYKTGKYSAIFENTINLSNAKGSIPTARLILDPEKQPSPATDVHVWDNNRSSSTSEIVDNTTIQVVQKSCPAWNEFRDCKSLGILGNTKNADFTIYPNPASASIHINGLENSIASEISISSIEGKLISKTIVKNINNTLSVNTLPQGMYIIAVTTKTGASSQVFVKN